jgi:hypothetical protein
MMDGSFVAQVGFDVVCMNIDALFCMADLRFFGGLSVCVTLY